MKKTMLSIVMMLFCVWGYAQELPKIVPPSPTAYELGKYGDIPVNSFSGTIQHNIPLITYKTNNLVVPISISYNSNGIKVDQLTSNVGLGWSLNIGGVISRVVKGKPDENRTVSIPQNIIGNYESDEAISYFYNLGNNEALDSQIDVFNFNFLGKSGKFVLNQQKEPMLLNSSELKIERIQDGFLIIDGTGVKYYFTSTESSKYRSRGNGQDIWSQDNITAWYLTKIVHPKGDEIYFQYSTNNYSYDIGKSQSLKGTYPFAQTGCNGIVTQHYTASPISTNEVSISGKRIIQIYSNNSLNGKVKVDYNTSSPVLSNYYLVDKVTLSNNQEHEIEKVSFNYLSTSNNRNFLANLIFKDVNKKYEFNYIDPNSFPQRLSFSQDHWGYYNGKSNTYFFPNPTNLPNIGSPLVDQNIGANKDIDINSAKKGMLKEIIHPTKGSTFFEYESNNYYGSKRILPPLESVYLIGDTQSSDFNGKTVSTIITDVNFTQTVRFNSSVSFNDYDGNCVEIPHYTRATVKAENITNPGMDEVFSSDGYSIGNSFQIEPENRYSNLKITLTEGNDYKITLTVAKPCILASVGFNYYKGPSEIVNTNIPQGGVRIKSIKNKERTFSTPQIKRYYYGKKETLNQSSGVKGINPWYVFTSINRQSCEDPNSSSGQFLCLYKDIIYKSLASSSVRQFYQSSTAFTTNYKNITISYGGDNFENGGEELEYYTRNDQFGNPIYGNHIQGSVKNNWGWDNGLLKRQTSFRKNGELFLKVREKENTYTRDNNINNVVYGFTVRKNFDLLCTYAQPDIRNLDNLDIMENSFRTNWHYLDQTTEKQYDNNGSNPIITTTNYYYDNPDHLQQTRVETTNSQGEVIKTETKYAHDVNDTRLISEYRIAEPINVETTKEVNTNTIKLSNQNTVYKDFAGLYLPEVIQTSKDSQTLEDRVVYHSYDDKGNPTEVSKKDGTKIYYVWGYQQTQPIAKIEGYTDTALANITSLVNTAVSASNNDTDVASENNLRLALNAIRNNTNMANSQVTTFTYDPLIGVTSITDPRGQTIYYEYDGFNRLEFIKDADGNLLKEHKYNYKN